MGQSEQSYYYPDRMGRIFLLALEEIIGTGDLKVLLDLAALSKSLCRSSSQMRGGKISFEGIARLQVALEDTYGEHGGRGLALRAGRTRFKYGLREYDTELGLNQLAFRLLPMPKKLDKVIESFSNLFNQFSDQRVRVERVAGQIDWHIERCPLCWQRRTEDAVCHQAVGLMQEALYWASGGKMFLVEETSCAARGDPRCVIRVDMNPIN